jgi:hypothetical protein
MAKKLKNKTKAALDISFKKGDQVRLTENFNAVAAGSEGIVQEVEPTSSLTVNILRNPECEPMVRVLRGAPMDIFDKDCHCDLDN